jgi:hypothetical protein
MEAECQVRETPKPGPHFTMAATMVCLGILSQDKDLASMHHIPLEDRIKMRFRAITRENTQRKERINRLMKLIARKDRHIRQIEWDLAKIEAEIDTLRAKGSS